MVGWPSLTSNGSSSLSANRTRLSTASRSHVLAGWVRGHLRSYSGAWLENTRRVPFPRANNLRIKGGTAPGVGRNPLQTSLPLAFGLAASLRGRHGCSVVACSVSMGPGDDDVLILGGRSRSFLSHRWLEALHRSIS